MFQVVWFEFSPRLKLQIIWSLTINSWFEVDLLDDVKVFFQVLANIAWTVFFQYSFNQLYRLLAAVEMFAMMYMMIYFLHLHIFQTTSVNARWGQPLLIQPQSFPKQASGWMLLYAMFL